MKKYITAVVITVLAFSMLTACGNKENKNDEVTTKEAVQNGTTEVPVMETETIISENGTVLKVNKVKDKDGNEIYVETVENGDGTVVEKQVIVNKDKTVTFVDISKNEKGEYVTEKVTKPVETTRGNGEQYIDDDFGDKPGETIKKDDQETNNEDDFNNGSGWSDLY